VSNFHVEFSRIGIRGEHSNETSGFIEEGLKSSQLPEKNCAPCTSFNIKILYRKVGNGLG
jgi:hypothetical protein